MKLFATVLSLLLLLTCAGSTQPTPAPPPVIPSPAAAEASLHAYGARDKTCVEWTDSCRTCTRADSGSEICSNIGPTCQPAAISCVRRSEPAK
jgi:hypothetical protein